MNPQGQPDPTTEYAQLKAAVMGAQQAGGASPLGNFPELEKLYGNVNPQAQKSQQVAGNVYNAQVDEANAKKARETQNAMLDASKYSRVPAADGGWNFIAPNGQLISANDYSRITGQSLDKVLSNSQNPIDQGFADDYNNLQDFLSAIRNKDTAKVNATIADNPELDKYKNDLPGLIQTFKEHYPTVFGGNKSGNQPVNSTYIPNAGVAASNHPELVNTGLSEIGG